MALYIPSIDMAVKRIVMTYLTEDYSKIKETMDYVINNPTIAGDADNYHNAAVNLVQIDDYDNAVILLTQGLTRYPRSTDILADLLEYGMKCRPISEIRTFYFDKLAKIDKRFWSWRAFHFSIDFLMIYIQYAENKNQEQAVINEIEKLISEYKKYKPTDERAYMVEHDFYELLNQHDLAKSALKTALDNLTICPQCALNYADKLFEAGKYEEALPYLERAVRMAEAQSSINLGYAYFLLASSKENVFRNKGNDFAYDNIKPIFDAYYSALEFLGSGMDHIKEQIYKNIRILEYQSGIKSNINNAI